MAGVSNADIMDKLYEISSKQAVMDVKLDRVEIQATKTNGRVNSLEEWKTGLIAIANERDKHPNQPQQINAPNATTVQVMTPTKWFQSEKLVGGVVIFLVAVAAFISFYTGGPQ